MTKHADHMPLFPDEETIALEVMGPKRARDWPAKARYLEDKHGLPAIDPLMGGRFWPAVEAFFRVRYGVKPAGALDGGEGVAPSSSKTGGIRIVPYKADGKEQYDGPEASTAHSRRFRGRGHR
ncbi:hypothetical protein H8A97_30395 [Bradyrhizobium sp. Arg62]|uniref:hypothetical protein n=1 Tax=Bradyrhizobium brasilense TaxID=1419277 RepID=UPI001E46A844|nr:hypothetical protein [Bradyrhizobium brasilense]MCC8949296.1 hypothetical protein [Bradyrhizobium brasilense]